jgi:hypothetical protein
MEQMYLLIQYESTQIIVVKYGNHKKGHYYARAKYLLYFP